MLKDDHRFAEWTKNAKAALISRCTPAGKAQIVDLITNYYKCVSVVIGDGANDVAMMHTAPLSIGIRGSEGSFAANAADVSIVQFKATRNLIFVYGAWNYLRLSKMNLYMLYKNFLIGFCCLFFAGFMRMNPILPFDQYSISLNNIIFTTIPVLALSLLAKKLSYENRLRFPQVYRMSNIGEYFNLWSITAWMSNALIHSTIIFFGTFYLFENYSNIIYFRLLLMVEVQERPGLILSGEFWIYI